jgi:hypothetical protein
MSPRTPWPASRQIFGSWVLLPGARLAGDDHDLVVADGGEQLVLALRDGQALG